MNEEQLTFVEILNRSTRNKARTVSLKEGTGLPVKAGRQSMPEGSTTIGGIFQQLALVSSDFPIEVLDYLENLAKYHPDVSLAVENVVTLGNTPMKVTFDDSVSDSEAKKMNKRLARMGKTWYSHAGGVNTLVNDLLAQAAINGAVSAEIVPDNSLEGVKKVVLVAPKSIRFTYSKELDEYEAHQIPTHSVQITNTDGVAGGNIRLNNTTYSYIGLRRFGEKPYAIPPFLAALWNIQIGRDMMESISTIVSKLGVMGFLEVLVKGLQPIPNEGSESYYNRTRDYLSKIAPEIEKGLSKGYVVGFEGSHQFKLQNTTTNVTGTKDLVELNDVKMMAGLKQDPFMLGRNFSTTETLGRVILAKMTTQIHNYQHIVASFLEKMYLLDLQLAGFKVESVGVEFDTPMIGDKVKEQTAKGQLFDNLKKQYDQGIISQTQFATELGREKPDQEEPRVSAQVFPVTEEVEEDEEDPTDTDPKTTEVKKKLARYAHLKEFEYTVSCGCENKTMNFTKATDDVSKFAKKYFKASQVVYRGAVSKMTKKIGRMLLDMGEDSTEQSIVDAVLYTLYKDWDATYTAPQTRVVKKFVNSIYKYFREDKSVFKIPNTSNLPDSVFSSIDLRALDYYKKLDSIYLGKFITDADVKNDVTKFIKEQMLTRNLPIGNNKDLIDAFNKDFGKVLQLKEWKIAQIVSTSTNKMRNSAAVAYFQQAEVDTFEIRGVNDSLQCGYCSNLQGLQFTVSKTVDALESSYKSNPEVVGVVSPFLTSLFKKPQDMENLTGSQLQDLGFSILPAHPNCRDLVIPLIN